MTTADWIPIISSVIGAITTGILAIIAKGVGSIRRDIRRFMLEHLYLLRVADWAKVNLTSLFDHLQLTPTEPPPLLPGEDKLGKKE